MGLWDQNWLTRSPSSEFEDHSSKAEIDEMLRPPPWTKTASDPNKLFDPSHDMDYGYDWVNPWGEQTDLTYPYDNLPFAGEQFSTGTRGPFSHLAPDAPQNMPGHCHPGYTPDPRTGECIADKRAVDGKCADRGMIEDQFGNCVPNTPVSGKCADPTYVVNPKTGLCEPPTTAGNGCPAGQHPDASGACVPDTPGTGPNAGPTWGTEWPGLFGKEWSDFEGDDLPQYPGVPDYRGPERPELPTFDYEKWQPPDEFKAPTIAEAQAAPGFQMRMDQGRKALEASAASKGMLRSGQTYTDLMDYGQKMGEMGYQDVYGRRVGEHQQRRGELERDYATGYGVAKDVYGAERKNILDLFGLERDEARDRYAPQFKEWEAETRAAELDRDWERKRDWDEYRIAEDRWERDYWRDRWGTAYDKADPGEYPLPQPFRIGGTYW